MRIYFLVVFTLWFLILRSVRSPEEAGDYVRSLQALLRAVGASDGNMEKVWCFYKTFSRRLLSRSSRDLYEQMSMYLLIALAVSLVPAVKSRT